MPREKSDYTKPASTFIGKGIVIDAEKMSGAESVRIDGLFNGDVVLDGYLQLGETGCINGNLHVSYALIAGRIIGDVMCRATLHMTPGSVIEGDVTTGCLIVDEGAILHGFCKTRDAMSDTRIIYD